MAIGKVFIFAEFMCMTHVCKNCERATVQINNNISWKASLVSLVSTTEQWTGTKREESKRERKRKRVEGSIIKKMVENERAKA